MLIDKVFLQILRWELQMRILKDIQKLLLVFPVHQQKKAIFNKTFTI